MRKTATIAAALALAAFGAVASLPAQAQGGTATAPALPMQFGQRVQLGPMMGERVIREVMISEGGGGLAIAFEAPPGQPESKRVLRLENVNGMLEVIYDTAMPSAMPLASGGTPRLVQQGGGMYSVEYDR
jgi:hypothetical protein